MSTVLGNQQLGKKIPSLTTSHGQRVVCHHVSLLTEQRETTQLAHSHQHTVKHHDGAPASDRYKGRRRAGEPVPHHIRRPRWCGLKAGGPAPSSPDGHRQLARSTTTLRAGQAARLRLLSSSSPTRCCWWLRRSSARANDYNPEIGQRAMRYAPGGEAAVRAAGAARQLGVFARPGVLRFLVLDEVHTYTGKRGADVAAPHPPAEAAHQHRRERCAASPPAPPSRASRRRPERRGREPRIADFATPLFGEPFSRRTSSPSSTRPCPTTCRPSPARIAEALADGPKTLHQLARRPGRHPRQIQQALSNLQAAKSTSQSPVPKLHAFFSQGRAITACLAPEGPHLNDRGEITCPACATRDGRERPTFPWSFAAPAARSSGAWPWTRRAGCTRPNWTRWTCRAAGLPACRPARRSSCRSTGSTPTGKVRGGTRGYTDVCRSRTPSVPICGRLDGDCDHAEAMPRDRSCRHPFSSAPPAASSTTGARASTTSSLLFGSVGRSTATDVLVSAQVQALPRDANKVIAFSDNRQDTALQAAHMNSLHNRFTFRRTLYTALREGRATWWARRALRSARAAAVRGQARHGVLPEFRTSQRIFGRDGRQRARYQQVPGLCHAPVGAGRHPPAHAPEPGGRGAAGRRL